MVAECVTKHVSSMPAGVDCGSRSYRKCFDDEPQRWVTASLFILVFDSAQLRGSQQDSKSGVAYCYILTAQLLLSCFVDHNNLLAEKSPRC